MLRKTKIICTLGPSTDQPGVLEALIDSGMNVARFNFSHGTHDEQRDRFVTLKKARNKAKLPVAALLDTKGPEIRLKTFREGKVQLLKGQTFTLTTREVEGDASIVSITYADLVKDVKAGDMILLDDGSDRPYHQRNHRHRHHLRGSELRPGFQPQGRKRAGCLALHAVCQ